MNKTELIRILSEKMLITQCEARRFVNTLQTTMTEELEQDRTLVLQGFGTFRPWQQANREGRNPKTGESCPIHARMSVKFKPGKILLKKLNP